MNRFWLYGGFAVVLVLGGVNFPIFAQPVLQAREGFTVNIAAREDVRAFFNAVYRSSDGVPMESTADVANCVPGINSGAFLEATLRRVNWFRAIAGVPANVTFNPAYYAKCQQAALMMSKNKKLSHSPPSDWLCYTRDGAEIAARSLLSHGYAGPDAVTDQMRESGENNAAVGHRRWILYPQTQVMATGDVPAQNDLLAANCLWADDLDHRSDPRPPVRDDFVSWPPPGFVPYQVVSGRWSFSYPNANFSGASLTITSNGVPLTIRREVSRPGYGENTLVWVPTGLGATSDTRFGKPDGDTVYSVTVSNATGAPRSVFNYSVTVFDPDVPSPGYRPP